MVGVMRRLDAKRLPIPSFNVLEPDIFDFEFWLLRLPLLRAAIFDQERDSVIDMPAPLADDRRSNAGDVADRRQNGGGLIDAALDDALAARELHERDGRADLGHAQIEPENAAKTVLTVIDKAAHIVCERVVVRDDHAAFAALDRLVYIEREHPDVPHGAGVTVVSPCKGRLRIVLDQVGAAVLVPFVSPER